MSIQSDFMHLPLPRRIWWPWDQPAKWVGFERRFTMAVSTNSALFVSASGPYQIWLDKTPIAVPESLLPSWRMMHRISLELSAGEHWLSFEAQPGNHGQPFLLACLDWLEDETPRRIPTDREWLMAREPEDGWQIGTCRDGWQSAWAFDGVWAEPWGMPCNAPQDFCRLGTGWQQVEIEPLRRVAILFQGLQAVGASVQTLPDGTIEFSPAQPYAEQPPRLENTRPKLEWYRNREAHSLILKSWLAMFDQRAPHVVLDVGQETFGRLVLRLRNGGPAILAISTGESLEEARSYGRWATDVIQLRDGERFATSPIGYRYAKISCLRASNKNGKAVLEPIAMEHIRYPAEQCGQFHCSDSLLDDIWQLSARTVHLCMQNEVWDGIKRDQLPWMGDLYTEALAIYHIFGDGRLCRRTLEILAEVGPAPARPLEAQRYPGLVAVWRSPGGSHPGAASGFAGGGDINGIPSYTLWWILGLADYVRYIGDFSLITAVAGELIAALEHLTSWVGEDGRWRFHGGWDFVDWSPIPADERETFCHLLAMRALQEGMDLLAQMENASVEQGLNYPRQTWQAIYNHMVNAARKTWVAKGRFSFGISRQVNAMAIRSSILTPPERATLFAQTLAPDPPTRMTFWHRYLDLEAASLAGQYQWGLESIRKHWGPQATMGATTLWEAYDPAWSGPDPHGVSMVGAEWARYGGYETSLCHAWSAGPAIWLHTAILGIKPAQPGFTSVAFAPHLGDLEWAAGAVPTPYGAIRVELSKRAGKKPLAEMQAPRAIRVELAEGIRGAWDLKIRV